MSDSHKEHLDAHKKYMKDIQTTRDILYYYRVKKEGYPEDNQPNELVYSSILGKYINPTTGEVVEKEKV